MTVYAQDRFVDVGSVLDHISDHPAKIMRYGIPHCVREIDRCGTGIYHRLKDLAEEIKIAPARVFSGKLHIAGVFCSIPYRSLGHIQYLLPGLSQFILEVDIRGGKKDMYSRIFPLLYSLPCSIDVFLIGTGQGSNLQTPEFLCNALNTLKVTWGNNRKSGLDHIDIQLFQLPTDLEFLLNV